MISLPIIFFTDFEIPFFYILKPEKGTRLGQGLPALRFHYRKYSTPGDHVKLGKFVTSRIVFGVLDFSISREIQIIIKRFE